MSAATHTPGPWCWSTSNSWRRLTSEARDGVNRPDGGVLCPVVQPDGHPDVLFSNGGPDGPDALLIAAAPDLLAVVSELLLWNDLGEPNEAMLEKILLAARAAQAKAGGAA